MADAPTSTGSRPGIRHPSAPRPVAFGVTVLMYAASAGKTDAVELLVEAGAALDLVNHDDFSALDLASNIEILRYLKAQLTSQLTSA